jgi:protein SCO1/2
MQTMLATKQKTVGKPSIGGPFTLVDSNGRPVTNADFRGRFMLLYFGFTRCPDICPSELVKVGTVLDQLGPKVTIDGSFSTLFISVDPQRDSLSQLQSYAKDFHPTITYLTGTKDQVEEATRAFRVYFIKANENEADEEDYLVDHSTVMYLMSPSGELLEFFTSSVTALDIAKRIDAHVHPRVAEVGFIDVMKSILAQFGTLIRGTPN